MEDVTISMENYNSLSERAVRYNIVKRVLEENEFISMETLRLIVGCEFKKKELSLFDVVGETGK